jgi:hypothetical protein
MQVCMHSGILLAVLTRNEHCPPHVHVGTDRWEGRFEFSFWHNSVTLLDVVPTKNIPNVTMLEEIRLTLKTPRNLKKARSVWWLSMRSTCLENQKWDVEKGEVVFTKSKRIKSIVIESSRFDPIVYKTEIFLAGCDEPLEITL